MSHVVISDCGYFSRIVDSYKRKTKEHGGNFKLPKAVLVGCRDGFKCHYCGVPLYVGRANVKRPLALPATVDHWKPRVLGGDSEMDNLRLACAGCNTDKGDMTPAELVLGFRLSADE
jgi:5-methylcytosine-specific restriction endonuclease McrA